MQRFGPAAFFRGLAPPPAANPSSSLFPSHSVFLFFDFELCCCRGKIPDKRQEPIFSGPLHFFPVFPSPPFPAPSFLITTLSTLFSSVCALCVIVQTILRSWFLSLEAPKFPFFSSGQSFFFFSRIAVAEVGLMYGLEMEEPFLDLSFFLSIGLGGNLFSVNVFLFQVWFLYPRSLVPGSRFSRSLTCSCFIFLRPSLSSPLQKVIVAVNRVIPSLTFGFLRLL